ncbi:unnamed protein product [Didymodactylos carnosus]|uniref:Uncharacterized protein n=1 Tax=Didymodactylos carnosus TaxID=1234261 RepID=A0A814X261_9BILA|nr:unnamed protein product [Didymodactylos carnosus]CAF1492252.1 unnamed protein product [Didymodactylos carnosus]CAF3974358.1 unnamed protein product [Didymodactylos carnosus]CAF4281389.1 unnamed protein product [Didymodactylos carnosus]
MKIIASFLFILFLHYGNKNVVHSSSFWEQLTAQPISLFWEQVLNPPESIRKEMESIERTMKLLNTNLTCRSQNDCFAEASSMSFCSTHVIIISRLNEHSPAIETLAKRTFALGQKYAQLSGSLMACVGSPTLPRGKCDMTNNQCVAGSDEGISLETLG